MKWVQKEYRLRFTEDERSAIQQSLASYPTEAIERFFPRLEGVCTDYKSMREQPNAAQSWGQIEETLPHLKKASTILKKIRREGIPVENISSVPGSGDRSCHFLNDEKSLEAFFDSVVLAGDAAKAVDQLITSMERLKPTRPGRGKPKTEGGFALAVAEIFEDYFGSRPTEKTLSGILAVCLDCDDPGRRVKATRRK